MVHQDEEKETEKGKKLEKASSMVKSKPTLMMAETVFWRAFGNALYYSPRNTVKTVCSPCTGSGTDVIFL